MLVIEGDTSFMHKVMQQISSDRGNGNPIMPNIQTMAPYIGPLGAWSSPKAGNTVRLRGGKLPDDAPIKFARNYPLYSKSGPDFLRGGPADRAGRFPELVVVDGRFRMACALRAIKEWGDRPIIMIDDFADRELMYSPVMRFADPWYGFSDWVSAVSSEMLEEIDSV